MSTIGLLLRQKASRRRRTERGPNPRALRLPLLLLLDWEGGAIATLTTPSVSSAQVTLPVLRASVVLAIWVVLLLVARLWLTLQTLSPTNVFLFILRAPWSQLFVTKFATLESVIEYIANALLCEGRSR